jgi:hypothetical protein
MTHIKFEDLWSTKWGIPKEKLVPFCELELHDRNYTEFIKLPPPPKKKMTDEEGHKVAIQTSLASAT